MARSLGGALVASVVALAIVQAWQLYAAPSLGLSFAGGNNDLAGEALRNWLAIGRHGVADLVEQLHAGSARGLLGAAFYYPWWLLAIAGYAASGRDNRRWALAVIFAAGIPAIAFSTRFTLPRIAYFMFPAVYLLAARGLEVVARWSSGQVVKWTDAGSAGERAAAIRGVPNAVSAGVVVVVVLGLIVLSNVDLAGNQQLNLWFHYSQGNGW
jgi:hypothetical protein